MGPLMRTRGMKYIIVATDYATRYAEIAAIVDATAETSATFLLHRVVLVHGAPMRVLSDQGTNFLSDVFREMLRLINVRQVTTTAFRPQCNGLTERLNKTIAVMLYKFVHKKTDEWAYFVPFIQFAYNSAIQSTMTISPYEALFGRPARLPLDATLPLVARQNIDTKEAIADQQAIAQAAIAQRHMRAVQRNDTFNVHVYKPGDLVSVHLTKMVKGEPNKLQSSWHGPCRVLRSTDSPDVYETQTMRKRKPVDYFNIEKIKPYVARDEQTAKRGAISAADIPKPPVSSVRPFEHNAQSGRRLKNSGYQFTGLGHFRPGRCYVSTSDTFAM